MATTEPSNPDPGVAPAVAFEAPPPYAIGVDFGRAFTAAAVAVAGTVEVAALGGASTLMPSLVYVAPDGSLFVGDAAARRGVSDPGGLARDLKGRVGVPTPLVLQGRSIPTAELIGRLLATAVDGVTRGRGRPPGQVVLSHPAHWSARQLEELLQLARAAGLPGQLQLTTEPEAVARHHASHEPVPDGADLAVLDVGAAGSVAAVLQRSDEGWERRGEALAPHPFGGADLDEVVFRHVVDTLGARLDASIDDPATRNGIRRLRLDCVAAKEDLSRETDTVIPVSIPTYEGEVLIARPEFERAARSLIEGAATALRLMVEDAGVGPADLHAVVLAGGSAHVPLIAEVVAQVFDRPVLTAPNPDAAVALGAAAAAPAAAHGARWAHRSAGEATAPMPPVVRLAPEDDVAEPVGSRRQRPHGDGDGDDTASGAGAGGDPVAPPTAAPTRPPAPGGPPPPAPRAAPAPRRRLLVAAGAAAAAVAAMAAFAASRDGATPGSRTTTTAPPEAATRPIGDAPLGVALADGGVWVSTRDGVRRVDAATGEIEAVQGPGDLGDLIAADGAVWVSAQSRRQLVRIDPRTRATRETPLPGPPADLAFGGGAVWVVVDDALVRVGGDGRAGVPIDLEARAADVEHAYGSVWVALIDDDAVARVDPATGDVEAEIPVGATPVGVQAAGGSLWVTAAGDGEVVRIDPATDEVVDRVRTGAGPWGLAAADGALWVANSLDHSVTRIGLEADGAVGDVTTVVVGRGPDGIAVGDGAVWVANALDGTLSTVPLAAFDG